MEEERTVAWKQTITLTFTNPADRVPVFFFESSDALTGFMDEAMSTRAELAARSFQDGADGADLGILSIEPAEHVSLTERFYLLPIIRYERVRVNRRPRKILQVASINLDAEPPAPPAAQGPFPVGITFVVDTSTSMQPYIDRTKEAIRRILAATGEADTEADFSFGLVGFRSDQARTPGLDYTAKSYHPLEETFDEETFLAALGEMNATRVSSHDFDEDGLSGMMLAAESEAWEAFGGRYIIYISDAGMLVGEENGSAAGTTPELLATRMRADLRIATFALLLKTRAGRGYHQDAIEQLEALTEYDAGGTSAVFPIEDGDVDAFGRQVDLLVEALVNAVGAQVAERAGQAPPPCDPAATPVLCAATERGLAMALDWRGRQTGTQAPDTYEAWAADFALDDPSRRAMTPRVLLTRAQLNDLYVTLQGIVEAYRQSTDDDPAKFFSVLRTVLGRTMRDPSTLPALDASQGARVAEIEEFDDLGDLVSDYLEGLPYDSDLATETLERWLDRGPSGQYEFINAIRSKLQMYELYYADEASWVTLNPAASETEQVYPIPLEMMP
jgi:hypothetical protein